MITPEEIAGKALRRYTDYQRSLIQAASIFPLYISADKKASGDFAIRHKQLEAVISRSKDRVGYGYTLVYRTVTTRKHGTQDEIETILFETEDDYLTFLQKTEQAASFKRLLAELLQWQPTLKEWLAAESPDIIHQHAAAWKDICLVVNYLLSHDVTGFYIRTVPVPVHTKFLERYKAVIYSLVKFLQPLRFNKGVSFLEEELGLLRKQHLFSMRWLDQSFLKLYSAGMEVLGISAGYLSQVAWPVKRIILVENETNLYLFPSMAESMVLCSAGGALHLLKDIPVFAKATLYYWGDLDEKGFTLLQDMRTMYPHVISLMMDEAVVVYHRLEMDRQPKAYRQREMSGLTPDETRAYHMLAANQGRIEQERLKQAYMLDQISKLVFA